jgi:hypothetical protein
MENQKIYLLAELIVGPEFLDEVKAIAREALIPLCVTPGSSANRDIIPVKAIRISNGMRSNQPYAPWANLGR